MPTPEQEKWSPEQLQAEPWRATAIRFARYQEPANAVLPPGLPEWLMLGQACERFGVPPHFVRQLAEQGVVRSCKTGEARGARRLFRTWDLRQTLLEMGGSRGWKLLPIPYHERLPLPGAQPPPKRPRVRGERGSPSWQRGNPPAQLPGADNGYSKR